MTFIVTYDAKIRRKTNKKVFMVPESTWTTMMNSIFALQLQTTIILWYFCKPSKQILWYHNTIVPKTAALVITVQLSHKRKPTAQSCSTAAFVISHTREYLLCKINSVHVITFVDEISKLIQAKSQSHSKSHINKHKQKTLTNPEVIHGYSEGVHHFSINRLVL